MSICFLFELFIIVHLYLNFFERQYTSCNAAQLIIAAFYIWPIYLLFYYQCILLFCHFYLKLLHDCTLRYFQLCFACVLFCFVLNIFWKLVFDFSYHSNLLSRSEPAPNLC